MTRVSPQPRPARPIPPLEPLSQALLPLIFGLTHRMLLRLGVADEQLPLAGISTHLLRADPAPQAAQGPPLVLVHGIADSALTWAFMIRPLTKVGPVFAVDLPGFGQSGYPRGRRYATISEQVAVVAALIRERVGRPALLVGNSMGAWVAARLALEHPELVRGVILLDPGGAVLQGRESWQPFVDTVAVRDLASVRLIYRQMFGRVPLPLYLGQRSFQRLFSRDPVAQFVAAADEAEFFRPEDLGRISVPVGLVWGERDRFLPSGSLEFFRDNLPRPELLMLPRCGHLPQRERPRAVVRFVQRFAATISANP